MKKILYILPSFRCLSRLPSLWHGIGGISPKPKPHSGLLLFIPKFKLISTIFYFCFIFTFHISLFTFDVLSQQPTQEWEARYPGPSRDLHGPFLAVDKQGNSYVAGTHVINDSTNILCVKYNTSGVQQWATLYKYPGYGFFETNGLALDSSGNAYVIGLFAFTYETPINSLIIKLNSSSGSPVWAKTYVGQYGYSTFEDIKIDRLNNIYVAGGTDSSNLVIRYNTDGDSVWVRKYRPPWRVGEVIRACTIDDSLNIIFTGLRRFFYPPFGYYDSLLVGKYSSGGVLRWESVYAYNFLGSDVGVRITNDQNGNTFIGGITTVSGLGVFLTIKYDRMYCLSWKWTNK